MTARRPLTAVFLLFVAVLFSAGPAVAQNLLVLPFENAGRDPRLDWIGEGFAELSYDRLAGDGRAVFSREEWLVTVEKMGLPASSRFSRATMLKIAEEVDADYVVFGSFSSDGKVLTAIAHVLRVEPLGLSAPLREAGSLEDVLEIHARLMWQILNFADSALPMSRDTYLASLERPRLDAFEQYVRGLSAATEVQRARYLREAARLAPEWSPPVLALGMDAFGRRDCAGALNWFSRISPEQRGGLEAAYYSGVCRLKTEPGRAEADFAVVTARAAVPEAFNNLGVARARQDKWREAAAAWQQAAQLEPGEADYAFNLGLAWLRADEAASAVRPLRDATRRKPDDEQARALLVVALERSGRTTEAAALREAGESADASSAAPRLKGKLSAPILPAGARRAATAGHRAAHLELHMARGRDFLRAGKLPEAQREFSEAILISPENTEAHVLLAETYERLERREDAIGEFRAALWSRENAGLRVRLAKLLLAQNQTDEARNELRAALKAEPGNAEARRLLDSMEAATAPGGRR